MDKDRWLLLAETLSKMSIGLVLAGIIGMQFWLEAQNDNEDQRRQSAIMEKMADTEEKTLEQMKVFTDVLADLLSKYESD